MNASKHTPLRILLVFVGLSHALIGAAVMVSPRFQQSVADLYGARVNWTPELTYVLRPLGAFMFALGLIALMAARHPARYRGIVVVFAVLLGIRVLQRLLFADDVQNMFSMTSGRLWGAAGFFAALAVGLLVLAARCPPERPLADRPQAGAP